MLLLPPAGLLIFTQDRPTLLAIPAPKLIELHPPGGLLTFTQDLPVVLVAAVLEGIVVPVGMPPGAAVT